MDGWPLTVTTVDTTTTVGVAEAVVWADVLVVFPACVLVVDELDDDCSACEADVVVSPGVEVDEEVEDCTLACVVLELDEAVLVVDDGVVDTTAEELDTDAVLDDDGAADVVVDDPDPDPDPAEVLDAAAITAASLSWRPKSATSNQLAWTRARHNVRMERSRT